MKFRRNRQPTYCLPLRHFQKAPLLIAPIKHLTDPVIIGSGEKMQGAKETRQRVRQACKAQHDPDKSPA